MKIILSKDIAGLGRAGQIKEVSDGHARNFLIPRHLAMPATTASLAKVQKEEAEREARIQRLQKEALELKQKLEGKTLQIVGKSKGKTLFAAIHEQDIARAINEKYHLAIEPKQVIIKKVIKTLGLFEIEIKLTDTLHAQAKIEVTNQT